MFVHTHVLHVLIFSGDITDLSCQLFTSCKLQAAAPGAFAECIFLTNLMKQYFQLPPFMSKSDKDYPLPPKAVVSCCSRLHWL